MAVSISSNFVVIASNFFWLKSTLSSWKKPKKTLYVCCWCKNQFMSLAPIVAWPYFLKCNKKNLPVTTLWDFHWLSKQLDKKSKFSNFLNWFHFCFCFGATLKIRTLNNNSHGLSPPGGFSSLFFDQAVPYYSQRHLHLHR